ncbi:MAG: hypothetical protein IJV54_15170 [Bacteroidales bacterium]|nr:hypothetical protein [Bacteroidales bacterium]
MDSDGYLFRRASAQEVEASFSLVLRRMAWMDLKGIRQWNVTGYVERFPLEYYREKQSLGQLYVLTDTTGKIVCVGVLIESDFRWGDDDTPSLYLHNFASDWTVPGCGSVYLEKAEKLARAMGKEYMRLDCARDNAFLNSYYSERGYDLCGTCVHGLYEGYLRQKKLNS